MKNHHMRERWKVENITEEYEKARSGWYGHAKDDTKNMSEDKHWICFCLREVEEKNHMIKQS